MNSTPARRYALFTLVGIAGEDDLDAPDLVSPSLNGTARATNGHDLRKTNGHAAASVPANGAPRRKQNPPPAKPGLNAEASAAAREQLLAEMADVVLGEELDRWAYRCLPTKNTLTAADARLVEDAFQVKLATLGAPGAAHDAEFADPSSAQPGMPLHGLENPQGAQERDQAQTMTGRIDKSLLTIPVPRRLRDKTHLRFVAKQPCLVCGRQPCDPHHLRFAQSRGLGQKVSDEFTVPLCRAHHRELHSAGKEVDWWARTGIEPIGIARKLWTETHPLQASARLPSDDSAMSGSTVATDDEVATAIPRRSQMTKRTQLPGPPR
jgi:hypothetical protein